jgi:hypothetical protein
LLKNEGFFDAVLTVFVLQVERAILWCKVFELNSDDFLPHQPPDGCCKVAS